MIKKTKFISVAEQVVRSLEVQGVKYVFGVPGEENEDLLFALENSSVQFVPTRHEQGASFIANVWGRITGKPGVCLSTLGPGATNLLTGLADAHLDKSPVVAITGQADSARLHKESHQYIDIVSMFRPITKWNTIIQNPNVTGEVIAKAFKLAQSEKPGVTHVDLPEDVAAMKISPQTITPSIVRRAGPDYKSIAQAVALITKAQRPIILAGNGAIRKRASKHLRLLSETFNIPVVATFMGKGAVSDRSPQSLFSVGLKAKDVQVVALENADMVITVGYDIAEYDPAYWNTHTRRPLVHIDFSPAEVYEAYQPTVEIVSDISGVLWELYEKLKEAKLSPFNSWYTKVRKKAESDFKTYAHVKGKKISVPFVLSQLRAVMHDTDILISDVGSHKMWIGRNFPVYEPGTCIISNGLASMGIALPGGIAAKLAQPDVRVVALMGDGGFLMNSQEIETAKRIGAQFTIIITNDNDYGLISWKQTSHRGRSVGTKIGNPDFSLYAKSFGIPVAHPKTPSEVGKVLKKALASNMLNMVVIDIDPSENLKLSAKLGKNLQFKL